MEATSMDENQVVYVDGASQKDFDLGESQKERFCRTFQMPVMWYPGRNKGSPS